LKFFNFIDGKGNVTAIGRSVKEIFDKVINAEEKMAMEIDGKLSIHRLIGLIFENIERNKEKDWLVNLIKAINLLNTAVRYNEEANSVDIQGDNMASITKALMKIEDAKVKTFIRLGKLVLENDPTSKVGIFVNYTTSLEKITESFKDYNPIILHGKIPKEKRQRLIDDYQKPDLTHRVIIANLQVCSTGIDLDDKHGGFKRYAFASPNYVILALQQLIYRFRRTNSKSSARAIPSRHGSTIFPRSN
jgi:SNF2 family DNA or RNA helicase